MKFYNVAIFCEMYVQENQWNVLYVQIIIDSQTQLQYNICKLSSPTAWNLATLSK